MRLLCAYAAAVEAGPLPGELTDVEFLETGVGKSAAAHSITRRLCTAPPPELVLLFGVAGAHRHSGLQVGALCLVTQEHLADEGVATDAGFLDLTELDLGSTGPFAMAPGPTQRAASRLADPHLVTGATVSTCSGTDARAAEVMARTGAAVETMEGAAVAYTCAEQGVPLVQLRAVSNFTGSRDQGAWDLAGACVRLQEAVRRIVAGGAL